HYSSPLRPAIHELETCRTDDEQLAASPRGQAVQEVEQPVVCPVNVLEHECDTGVRGERLEEPPPGGEHLASVASCVAVEADEEAKAVADPGCFRQLFGHDCGELRRRRLGGIVLHDSRACLHDLRAADVRHTTVRETTADEPGLHVAC